MIDLQQLRENTEGVRINAGNRNMHIDVDRLLALDGELREKTTILEGLRAERNALAKNHSPENAVRGKELKSEIAAIETSLQPVQDEFQELYLQIPNFTHPDSPIGSTDEDNKELRIVGEVPQFDFTPKDHVELGTDLDLLDFEAGAAISGSGFYFKKNALVLLEFAVIQLAIQLAVKRGFTPMITPDMVHHDVLQGTGYNPRGNESQIYSVTGHDLGLIATAEIPVAAYYRNHVFPSATAPQRVVAYSHAFRTEDGAYGRESRGLYRVHQFAKVELFTFCTPEDSEAELALIVEMEEELMQLLQIPYRVVDNCTGDLGASAYRKFDIEAWMPFKNGWGEVSSASNCTDYQSRRLNIKYEAEKGKRAYMHTLNGTAAALSRLPIAILENNQEKDGSIRIPAVLQPFMGGLERIEKKA